MSPNRWTFPVLCFGAATLLNSSPVRLLCRVRFNAACCVRQMDARHQLSMLCQRGVRIITWCLSRGARTHADWLLIIRTGRDRNLGASSNPTVTGMWTTTRHVLISTCQWASTTFWRGESRARTQACGDLVQVPPFDGCCAGQCLGPGDDR